MEENRNLSPGKNRAQGSNLVLKADYMRSAVAPPLTHFPTSGKLT